MLAYEHRIHLILINWTKYDYDKVPVWHKKICNLRYKHRFLGFFFRTFWFYCHLGNIQYYEQQF